MTTTKVTYSYFLEKKRLKRQNLRTKNGKNSKNSFFERTFNKECIGLCRKTKIQEIIFGNIHVKLSLHTFLAKGKYNKTVYMKNGWFFTSKSKKYIYLKSAPQELSSDRLHDGQR